MQEINVYDSKGSRIIGLTQWDHDVFLYVKEPHIKTNYDIHFFNNHSENSLVVNSVYENGTLKVKIPNSLMHDTFPIIGCVFVNDDDGGHKSAYIFKILVKKKPKPINLIEDTSIDYVDISSIKNDCLEFAKASESFASMSESYSNMSMESEKNAKSSEIEAINAKDDAYEYSKTSESWAIGGTGTRTGEDTNNSKYFSQQASQHNDNALTHETAAKSYVMGGTGTRTGEDTDNAKYYYTQLQTMMGNFSFATVSEAKTYLDY